MKTIAKYPALILFLFFIFFFFLFDILFGVDKPFLRAVFSTTLAFLLSPRRKKIKTQTGVKTQVTWVFLKEPIFLD
mgnify:CR=1 FL=1